MTYYVHIKQSNMKQTISEYDFCRAFETSDSRKDQFSHSAQKALYEYLVEYEESTGEDIELDIVALCCDYSEYSSALEEAMQDRGDNLDQLNIDWLDAEQAEDDELIEEEALEWLQEHTQVIPFDGTIKLSDGTILGNKGVIIQQF